MDASFVSARMCPMLMKLAPCSRTCSCGAAGIPNTGESNSVFIDGCYLGLSVHDQIFVLGCHLSWTYVLHISMCALHPQACSNHCMICTAGRFDPLQRTDWRFD